MFADSSSSGPIFGKNPSTYSRRDARRARKRGGPSAESCVRCLLLFSRTTKFSPDPKTEDVKRDLHMQKLTRHMMGQLAKRLNTSLPWAAAVHDDHTDVRHVHILAAVPKRLNTYDLEFLIRQATQLSLAQRRFLDRGVSRLPW